jgi:hypothetical protein
MKIVNGWPPNLRIESDGRVLGVGPIENEIFPANWAAFMPAAVRGTFKICPLGTETKVPYLDKPVPLYCIDSAMNAERLLTREGESKWVPLK